MRISDWSSDVCSSDLEGRHPALLVHAEDRRCAARVGRSERGDRGARGGAGGGSGACRCQIGRASGRERVWQYVEVSVVAVSLKKKISQHNIIHNPSTATASKNHHNHNKIKNTT